MESMFNTALETMLESGLMILPKDFWDLTFGEISQILKAKARSEKNRIREKVTHDYNLANLIGSSVAAVLDSKNKFPPIEEVYPALFPTEEAREGRQVQDWRLAKHRLMQYAKAHNTKRGAKENDN